MLSNIILWRTIAFTGSSYPLFTREIKQPVTILIVFLSANVILIVSHWIEIKRPQWCLNKSILEKLIALRKTPYYVYQNSLFSYICDPQIEENERNVWATYKSFSEWFDKLRKETEWVGKLRKENP